jgi:hypothetical protein
MTRTISTQSTFAAIALASATTIGLLTFPIIVLIAVAIYMLVAATR